MLELKDYLKLSCEEKTKRFHELSPKDRLLARMSDWTPEDVEVIENTPTDAEKQKQLEVTRQLNEALAKGEINLLK